MKKTKLVLRRSTIAQLTPDQLRKAAGAGSGESCANTDCCAGGNNYTRNDPQTNPMCWFTDVDCLPPPPSCMCDAGGK